MLDFSMPMALKSKQLLTIKSAFYILIVCISFIVQFILYTKGRQMVRKLQRNESKARIPLFWALSSLAHLFNIYMTYNGLLAVCFPYTNFRQKPRFCISYSFLGICTLASSLLAAFIHSSYITFDLPQTWSIFTRCCRRKQHRVITTISLWGIYCSVSFLAVCAPFQVLLVSTNPHLYGFGILTVWCAMFVCVILASIPFTIDQIFMRGEENRITPKQAIRQILLLMFIAVIVFGFGSLTFSITLVLHLSKYGEKTQNVATSMYFVLKHVAIPIIMWMAKRMLQKIRKGRDVIMRRLER